MKVSTTIMGVDICIQLATDTDRRGRRLGSVPLVDGDGNKHLLRIYGVIETQFTPGERTEFEKSVRAFCARTDVVEQLLGKTTSVMPVRFNPSEQLLQTGWKNRTAVSVIAH